MSPAALDYSDWTGLLADIVTPAGKVDYEALATRRDRLDGVIAMLGAASPESAPEVLDPAARARKLTSCEMCHRHVRELPTYADRR